MRRMDARGVLGGVLVLAGLLLLLQNFNVFLIPWDLFWAGVFLASGLAFLGLFLERPSQWWAPIPAFTLLAIGTMVFLGDILPDIAHAWGGSIFLGALGVSFWLVFAVNRKIWWAIIPGGVLVTLAAVASLPRYPTGPATGGVLFLGLGVTFGLVYLLAEAPGRMSWALVPAGVLAVLGVFIMAAVTPFVGFLWPLLFILVGGYLLLRALRSQRI